MMIFLQYTLVGLAGSLGLIILSKIIMAKALRRDEDFYDRKIDQGGDADE